MDVRVGVLCKVVRFFNIFANIFYMHHMNHHGSHTGELLIECFHPAGTLRYWRWFVSVSLWNTLSFVPIEPFSLTKALTCMISVENQYQQRISWRWNTYTTKLPYGENSVSFPYGKITLRRKFLWAKFPCGDTSYSEIPHSEILYGKISYSAGENLCFSRD